MHERQIALAVLFVLFFSITYYAESFAQTPQCNGVDATHVGTEGKDKIRGTQGDDVIVGLGGDDKIYGKGGNDIICGGDGNDKLYGNSGNDILLGEIGSDKLYGGQGIDTCDSSSEDKRVIGCETPHIGTIASNTSEDFQKQISDLQNQINSLILGLVSWTDIQGIPESLADGDDDMLANISCDAQQTLVYDGSSWNCDDVVEIVKIEANVESSHVDTTCLGNMINFAGLSHGASINDIQDTLKPFGVSLSAKAYGDNSHDTVIIYNSNIDDGKDSDLEVGIGNLAIIPDNLHKPSDSAKGGEQIYEFSSPKTIKSFVVVDIESEEAGTVTAYDADGNTIVSKKLPLTGNKDYKLVQLNAPDVSKLVIDYNSSGGLANICMTENNDDEPEITCEENQIKVFDGENWVCGSDNNTLGELNCDVDQIAKWDGTNWVCGSDNNTLGELNCDVDQIAKWDGTNWFCSENVVKPQSQIFFFFTEVGEGEISWVGTSSETDIQGNAERIAMLMSNSWEISNLVGKVDTSNGITTPGTGESYTLTILKNGVPTTLSCMISDDKSDCIDEKNVVLVEAGDTLVLKVESSDATPYLTIRSSVLLSSS